MAWVIGIALGLALLFAFPRQMFLLIGGLVMVAVIGGSWLYYQQLQETKAYEQRRNAIVMQPSYDPSRCGDEFPVLVTFTNTHTETLLSLNFYLRGFRDGFSSPVYETSITYSTDRIIPSGETRSACWRLPELKASGTGVPPASLIWRAEYAYASFGNPP